MRTPSDSPQAERGRSGHQRNSSFALGIKRSFDVVVSLLLMVLLLPIFALIAVVVLLGDGRPVLFRQVRVGQHGRLFNIVKFRTMVPDAENNHFGPSPYEPIGPVFKRPNDPRITGVGRWLRRLSIDELPQLWNVLKGEMSLVGPRPQPLAEADYYGLRDHPRLVMRPGMTGLWQVSARHDLTFESWLDLDLAYTEGWSLWLDARILLRTPSALIRMTGH